MRRVLECGWDPAATDAGVETGAVSEFAHSFTIPCELSPLYGEGVNKIERTILDSDGKGSFLWKQPAACTLSLK